MSHSPLFVSHVVRITPGRIVLDAQTLLHEVPVAESEPVDAFAIRAYKHFGYSYPKFYKMDSLSKYGWLAAELLLGSAKMDGEEAYFTAQVMQNAESSLDTDRLYAKSMESIPSPALFVYTLPNIVLGEIAIRHGLKGENTFFISAAFDAGQLHDYTSMLLRNRQAHRVLCGRLDIRDGQPDVCCCLVEPGNEGFAPFTVDELNLLYAAR